MSTTATTVDAVTLQQLARRAHDEAARQSRIEARLREAATTERLRCEIRRVLDLDVEVTGPALDLPPVQLVLNEDDGGLMAVRPCSGCDTPTYDRRVRSLADLGAALASDARPTCWRCRPNDCQTREQRLITALRMFIDGECSCDE